MHLSCNIQLINNIHKYKQQLITFNKNQIWPLHFFLSNNKEMNNVVYSVIYPLDLV